MGSERATDRALELRVFQTIAESTHEFLWVKDTSGRYLMVNGTTARAFAKPVGEIIGRTDADLVEPGLAAALVSRDRRVIGRGESERFEQSVEVDGIVRTFQLTKMPLLDDEGRVMGVIGLAVDVTRRRELEEALLESRMHFDEAEAIGALGTWSAVIDGTGRVSLSKQSFAILGLDPAYPVTIDRLKALVHPEDLPALQALGRAAVEQGTPYDLEHRIVHDGGAVRWVHERASVIRLPGGPPRLVGVVRDITEATQMQARLRLADRLVSLGTLAAGVAHEINSPLAYVIGNLQLVEEHIARLASLLPAEEGALLRDAIEDARTGADRVRVIVRGLKTFARPDDESVKTVDVRTVLASAINMANNEIRHRGRLVIDLGEVPGVLANEARLSQVFLNLLVNAAHAIPEGASGGEVRLATFAEGDRVVIEVSDTGVGIPKDMLARVFDPFFTTKPIGVGTGLGLSICHGIVTSLGGEITATSEVGRGSTFRVSLPRSKEDDRAHETLAPRSSPRRRARVLLIDDEPRLLKIMERLLEPDHEVTAAKSPHEAVERIERGERYDAILCDVMMPGLSGVDVYERVSRAAAEQASRMVFLTGGAFTPGAIAFLARVPNKRLEKPFEPDRLFALLDEVLA